MRITLTPLVMNKLWKSRLVPHNFSAMRRRKMAEIMIEMNRLMGVLSAAQRLLELKAGA